MWFEMEPGHLINTTKYNKYTDISIKQVNDNDEKPFFCIYAYDYDGESNIVNEFETWEEALEYTKKLNGMLRDSLLENL